MRISLISPKWHALVNSYPPLGLAYLAAMLEGRGHKVRIHDLGLTPGTRLEDGLADLDEFRPDLVGLTSMTNNHLNALEIARFVKDELGCPVVIGGPHSTVFPEGTARHPDVDYVVYGEGEITLAALVDHLEGRSPAAGIAGLCYKQDGEIVRNEPRSLLENLDELPFPARHLLKSRSYGLKNDEGRPMATVLTSRGCPYNCSYCFKGLFGRRHRQRSPKNVLAELMSILHNDGLRDFYFIDDLFTLNPQWLDRFTSLLIERKLEVTWHCLARVDRVSPPILGQMREAGCREIHYGIESGSEDILRAVSKGISLEAVRQAVRWTAEVGIVTKGYFMIGLPGDTEETIRQTIDFAAELDLDEAMFSLTTPFPGTRLWQELQEQNQEMDFEQDFSKAYYFNDNTERIMPFFNVSRVSNERLGALALLAARTFQDSRRRRKAIRRFGPRVGRLAWYMAKSSYLRKMGKRLLHTAGAGPTSA